MRRLSLILPLLLCQALGPLAAAAQTADELADLERRAEESFIADDLATAITLYRQLADRQTAKADKLRVLMTVASVQYQAGRDSDARATLVEVLVLEPAYEFRPELYSEGFRALFYAAQKQAAAERSAIASERTREGNEHYRQRDWAAARKSFEAALAAKPGYPSALFNLAVVNLNDGREDEAQAGFERLLALAAGDAGAVTPRMQALALTNLGYLYSRRGQYQEAEDALSRAVEIDPGKARTWQNLGDARRRLGKKELAAEAFRRAYELDPGDPDVISNLALAYLDAGDHARAAEMLGRSTARHPDNPHLWLLLGRAQLGLGDAAAVSSLERALTLDPQNATGTAADAAIHLAIYHYGIQDYRRALVEADRALGWRPDLVNGWVYQGLARQGLGDLGGALASLEKARDLDPTQAETYNNLGIVYYRLGRLEEARQACERALEIDPGFDDARRNLDAIHQAGGGRRPAAPPPAAANAPPPPPAVRTPPPPSPPPRRSSPPASSTAPGVRLGLRFSDVDYRALGIQGAMVESVKSGSPADRAGIRRNDLILKLDDTEVEDPGAFVRYVDQQGAGKSIVVELLRGDDEERVVLRTE